MDSLLYNLNYVLIKLRFIITKKKKNVHSYKFTALIISVSANNAVRAAVVFTHKHAHVNCTPLRCKIKNVIFYFFTQKKKTLYRVDWAWIFNNTIKTKLNL